MIKQKVIWLFIVFPWIMWSLGMLCVAALMVYFMSNALFFQRIIQQDSSVREQAMANIEDDAFAEFVQQFQAVELPLRIKAKSIEFADWQDIPGQEVQTYGITWQDALNDDHSYSVTSTPQVSELEPVDSVQPNQNSQGVAAIVNNNIEIKEPKYYYSVVDVDSNKQFVALMYLYKIYDDNVNSKVLYGVLTTYTLTGQKIDSLQIANATYYNADDIWLNRLLPFVQNKTVTRVDIDANYRITIEEKRTYTPYDGTTITSVWSDQGIYQIREDGHIQQIEKDTKVHRDE